jgi:hypothetical protein
VLPFRDTVLSTEAELIAVPIVPPFSAESNCVSMLAAACVALVVGGGDH